MFARKRTCNRWSFDWAWSWMAGEHRGEKLVRIAHRRYGNTLRGTFVRVDDFSRNSLADAIRCGMQLLRADAHRIYY